jgi:hypothetical protein
VSLALACVQTGDLGRPQLVTVFLGANDASIKGVGAQHIPVEQYARNLDAIVATLRTAINRKPASASAADATSAPMIDVDAKSVGSPRARSASTRSADAHDSAAIVLITPPPIDAAAWDATVVARGKAPAGSPSSRTNDVTGRYAAAVVAAGKRLSVPVIDLWNDMHRGV